MVGGDNLRKVADPNDLIQQAEEKKLVPTPIRFGAYGPLVRCFGHCTNQSQILQEMSQER